MVSQYMHTKGFGYLLGKNIPRPSINKYASTKLISIYYMLLVKNEKKPSTPVKYLCLSMYLHGMKRRPSFKFTFISKCLPVHHSYQISPLYFIGDTV